MIMSRLKKQKMRVNIYKGLYFKYYLTNYDYKDRYIPDAYFVCCNSRDAQECFQSGAKILSKSNIPDDIDSERHRYTLLKWDSETINSKL